MSPRTPGEARHRLPPVIFRRSRELRHPLTPFEKLVWDRGRNHGLGVHIRRQHLLLGRFVADFYCSSARTCIEIDGETHAEPGQVEYDQERTRLLEAAGIHVLRFSNQDVRHNLEGVVSAIQNACKPRR